MASLKDVLQEIERKASGGRMFSRVDVVKHFPDQAPLVAYAFKRALDKGLIYKFGVTRGAKYASAKPVVSGSKMSKTYIRGKESEDQIFREVQDVFLKNQDVGENARHIVSYAFTEMVNNAIDHSESPTVEVMMEVRDGKLHFAVRDRGIGAFRKVMLERDLPDESAAAAEITKGKVTTAPKWHSGQGIFFTSRAADHFRLSSGGIALERDNLGEGVTKTAPLDGRVDGTLVEFEVSTDTKRHLAEDVFGQFESDPDEHDFGKTEVRVSLFDRGNVHVSRSQAKRLVAGLEKFKIVTLDFDGVPFIGQGLADQIFRIFARDNQQTRLIVKNANTAVQMMIDRVEKPGATS